MNRELSPKLEHKYNEELRATLRRVGLLRSEKSELGKVLKEVIDTETKRSLILLDLLDGKITEQQALPGIEEATTAREQSIGGTLRRAVESARRICGIDDPLLERELDELDSPAPSAGVRAAVKRFVDSVPAGTSMTVRHGDREATIVGKKKGGRR